MNLIAQFSEVLNAGPFAQLGIGGAFLLAFVRFLSRLEVIFSNRMDAIEHAQRNLSKAVWMTLAEISHAGSFVREEAKRMIERDKRREEVEEDRAKTGKAGRP